jgi:hypothetical protein
MRASVKGQPFELLGESTMIVGAVDWAEVRPKDQFAREIATGHQHIGGAVRDLSADGFIICND